VAYHISRELAARGHEVAVFTTNALNPGDSWKASGREYIVDGILVRYFRNVAHLAGLYFSPGIMKALKKQVQNSDLIHMHEYRTFQNAVTYYIAKKCRKPYVLTAHGSVPRIFERVLIKQLFDHAIGYRILKGATTLCASSKIEMKQYVDAGIPQERVVLIPNGVDCEFFERLPEPGMFKKKFNLNENATMILYVGRIHRRKGIDVLIDAFAQLRARARKTDVLLCIAGSDGRYALELKDKASRLGMSENVVLTGFISDKDKLAAYVDCDVVVYPGIYESFPLVPIEAALCSKPVIVSNDSIMAEIVSEGGFGFSIKYGEVGQLKDLLQMMLDNPEVAAEMGRQGRRFVRANYDWRDIVSKLENTYSNAIAPN